MYPLLDEFEKFENEINLRQRTISEYVDAITKCLDFMLEYKEKSHFTRLSYRTITTQDMQTYMFKLREDKSVSTCNKYFAGIFQFFKWLQINKYIDTNPCIGVKMQKAEGKEEEVVMSYEQSMAMINFVTDSRNKLMLGLMGYMGLRIEEICNIEVKNINLQDNTLYFKRKTQKWQTLPVRKFILELLKEQVEIAKENNQVYLFKSPKGDVPMNTNTVRQMFNRVRDSLGYDKRFTPHHMRYAMATFMYQDKEMPVGEIQLYLGHEDPRTTERYIKIDNSKTVSKFARMDD